MNKNFLMATVAGGITLLVLAGLLYGLLADFFANDVERAVPVLWALILGELVYAAVLTVVWVGRVSPTAKRVSRPAPRSGLWWVCPWR